LRKFYSIVLQELELARVEAFEFFTEIIMRRGEESQ